MFVIFQMFRMLRHFPKFHNDITLSHDRGTNLLKTNTGQVGLDVYLSSSLNPPTTKFSHYEMYRIGEIMRMSALDYPLYVKISQRFL